MKAFALLAWFLCSALAGAVMEAFTLHQLWTWFCAREYGAGPSMGAWYGIAAITGLMLFLAKPAPTKKDEAEAADASNYGAVLVRSVSVWFSRWFVVAIGMGVTLAFGTMIGWIP